MNTQEAVEKFYNWEIKGRGYSLFNSPVDLEPAFQVFSCSYTSPGEYVDDGKTPSLFKRIFSSKKVIQKEENEEEVLAYPYEYEPQLYQLTIHFSERPDIKDNRVVEFLNMLSESDSNISFEIVGSQNKVDFRLICNDEDRIRIHNLILSYFPTAFITDSAVEKFPLEESKDIVIIDFGYDEEFIRPINTSISGLTSIMTIFERLGFDDSVVLQIILKGVINPWADSILNSVGNSKYCFFCDSPEMFECAKEKVSTPLFAVIIRLAVQSNTQEKTTRLANELISNISLASRSAFNSIIPLNNVDYEYSLHWENLNARSSNRLGMIMNSNELSLFVHFPDSPLLICNDFKTRSVPDIAVNNDYHIGVNIHNGVQKEVSINDSQRLRHCHIIGATGTGKSTLITTLFLEDINKGNGCVIFDPHGDTIDEIIPHIPKNRLSDIILIDPSDSEYSFGFNLLSSKNEVEKIVLSSDLVDAFKRHSTSWGDQMTSVLSNAINAFLNSTRPGSLYELKRFLIEPTFRKEFLKSVDDRSIHYYWDNEFNLLKKGSLSPLLTRLDTFLRPRTIRNMLSQKQGLDFNQVLNERKILLVKLSQGLIGEENSYLLGTLILSKIYQVALSRQSIAKENRNPFYIYLDEFQNFITPSINSILSGARKYGIGLILAHQELNQLKDSDIGHSVLSNTNIRICFRLGDNDAPKLESGFSHFDSSDLQNLNIGDAIVRIGRNTDDFSLRTSVIRTIDVSDNAQIIRDISRKKYSTKTTEIEEQLNSFLSTSANTNPVLKEEKQQPKESREEEKNTINIPEKGHKYLEHFTEKEEIREHRYLQTFIKKIAEQRSFKASIEETVDGGRIDVSLVKDSLSIACEIAVSNSVEYEIKNIQKCLNSNYSLVCVISKEKKHLNKIKEKAIIEFGEKNKINFFTPNQMTELLDSLVQKEENSLPRIRGYRVKVNYTAVNQAELENRNQDIARNTLKY